MRKRGRVWLWAWLAAMAVVLFWWARSYVCQDNLSLHIGGDRFSLGSSWGSVTCEFHSNEVFQGREAAPPRILEWWSRWERIMRYTTVSFGTRDHFRFAGFGAVVARGEQTGAGPRSVRPGAVGQPLRVLPILVAGGSVRRFGLEVLAPIPSSHSRPLLRLRLRPARDAGAVPGVRDDNGRRVSVRRDPLTPSFRIRRPRRTHASMFMEFP